MSDTKKPSPATFEAEFEAFLLKENSHLGELYRKLPHPEPDAAIDARLRARARQALREGDDVALAEASSQAISRASRSRMRRWLPGFGAAATLVLVAGLAWRLVPPTMPTREAAQASNTAAVVAPPGGQVASAPIPTVAPASKPLPPQVLPHSPDDASPSQHKQHRVEQTQTGSRPAAEATNADTASAANGGVLAGSPKAPASTIAQEKGEAVAFPRMAEQARMKNPPPPAAPTASPPAAAAEPAAAMSADRETATSAAAPATTPHQASNENRAQAEQALSDGVVEAGPLPTIQPDSPGSARYRWEIAAGAAMRSGVYPPDPPPPRAWVEIVRAMLRDGHRDAAKQALAELRSQHPDYRIPADLRGLE